MSRWDWSSGRSLESRKALAKGLCLILRAVTWNRRDNRINTFVDRIFYHMGYFKDTYHPRVDLRLSHKAKKAKQVILSYIILI